MTEQIAVKTLSILEGLESLDHELEFIVCTMDKNNIPLSTEEVATALESVSYTLAKLFGGFSRYQSQGGWTLPDGTLQVENNYTVTASIEKEKFTNENIKIVLDEARLQKELYRQDMISVKIDGKRFFL